LKIQEQAGAKGNNYFVLNAGEADIFFGMSELIFNKAGSLSPKIISRQTARLK